MTVFEFMEDYDNAELSNYERREQLEDAVMTYNEEHGTNHIPCVTFMKYEHGYLKQDDE